jgi:hypothetical protein
MRFRLSRSSRQAWRCTMRSLALGVSVGLAGCGDDRFGGSAAPHQQSHVLRLQGNGGGSGTVTAPDASPELACTITHGALSGVCTGGYPSNSAIRLVATPNGGSVFAGWSGACVGTDDCVLDMSQERTVTAAFGTAAR